MRLQLGGDQDTDHCVQVICNIRIVFGHGQKDPMGINVVVFVHDLGLDIDDTLVKTQTHKTGS